MAIGRLILPPRDTVAMEYDAFTHYLRGWKSGIAAWTYTKKRRTLTPLVPLFQLFDTNLNPHFPSEQHDPTLAEQNRKAMNAWLAELPDHLKTPAFASLERHQFLALEACQEARGFRELIEQEFASGSFNFLFAAWRLHLQAEQNEKYRKRFNRRLVRQKRGDILEFLMGEKISQLFLKILPRVDASLLDEDSLRVLLAATKHKPMASALSQVERIAAPGFLLAWESLPEWLYHPNILQCLMQLPQDTHSLAAVMPPAVLNAEGARRQQVLQSLKTAKNLGDFESRLHKLSFTFSLQQKFPAPPFVGTKLLYPVKTGKALQSEGKFMHNCVAGYASSIMAGMHYFYHYAGKEQATVLLEHNSGGDWSVVEHLGIHNSELAKETLTEIYLELARFTSEANTLSFAEMRVAGFYYRKTNAIWRKLQAAKGALLDLRAEPENAYDAGAIAVDFAGEHIGYVPRMKNKLLGVLLNAGLNLKGRLTEVGRSYEAAEIRFAVQSFGDLPPNAHAAKKQMHRPWYEIWHQMRRRKEV